MNYSVVSLVIVLTITLSQYVILRNQYASFRAKISVQESDTNELVKQLRAQVEPLKSQFETCKNERQKESTISKQQVDDLSAKTQKLEADLAAKQKEKDDTESAKNTVQQEKDTIAGEKAALDEKVKTLEADVAKLNEDIKAEQAKVAEAQKAAADAKAAQAAVPAKPEEEKKAPPLSINGTLLGISPNALQTKNQKYISKPPNLRFEDEPKSAQDEQKKEQLDKLVPKPKHQSTKQYHSKDEHADLTKELLDKEAVKDLPGKIVLDQRERERAQLPNVNPEAIQVKSIDKIDKKEVPKVSPKLQEENDDDGVVDTIEYSEEKTRTKVPSLRVHRT